jgi:glycosyltransferase involved in cell wall biosynthesis
MKIVLLGENGSVHIQKWIRALADSGKLELHVISFERGATFENVHYHFLQRITSTKLDYVLNIGRVRQFIRSIRPDIVHAHYATSYGYMAACSKSTPLIITGWGADIFDSPKQLIMRKMLSFSFSKANALTVLSEVTRREMKKYTDKPVQLIPFGVNTKSFTAVEREDRTEVCIGTVRTLTEKYGVEYLIRAVASIYSTNKNIRLSIVGDGPLREPLEALAVSLGIGQITTFHGFVNQNTEFARYKSLLDEMDIFSILSIIDSETFGVASVEASACGLPVLATSVGGLPEVVLDNETGLLVPPKNVDATAKALSRLVQDKLIRLEFGKAGRQYVCDKYDWANNVNDMIQLYQQTFQANS